LGRLGAATAAEARGPEEARLGRGPPELLDPPPRPRARAPRGRGGGRGRGGAGGRRSVWVGSKPGSVASPPSCSPRHLGLERGLREVAGAIADAVAQPVTAT